MCSMINIRAAFETDIPQILKIEQESFSVPWTHGQLLREIYNEESFFLLAVEKNDVLGFVILRCSEYEAQLFQIAVCGRHRRRGVADKMMAAALCHFFKFRQAAEKTPIKLTLEVRTGNTAAIKLYEKHGFNFVANRKNYYTHPTEDAVVMMREV